MTTQHRKLEILSVTREWLEAAIEEINWAPTRKTTLSEALYVVEAEIESDLAKLRQRTA